LVVGFLGTESVALAEPAPTDARHRADRAFEEGKERVRAGDWPLACTKFEESFALDPSASTQVKLARCREHEDRLIEAVAAYRDASELNRALPRDPARAREIAAVIEAELRRLEPTVPTLSVRLAPPDVNVDQATLDGQPLASGVPLRRMVNPGRHVLVLHAPGYRTATLELSLARGERRDVEVPLIPESGGSGTLVAPPSAAPPSAAPPSAALPPPPPAAGRAVPFAAERREPSDGGTQRWLGGALAGAGVAALLVGGYFGARTLALVDDAGRYCDEARGDCYPEGIARLESARRAQTAGIVAASIGGALAVTGVVVYLTAPRHLPDERSKVSLNVVLGNRSAALRGAF
jgi:hypothetical protein